LEQGKETETFRLESEKNVAAAQSVESVIAAVAVGGWYSLVVTEWVEKMLVRLQTRDLLLRVEPSLQDPPFQSSWPANDPSGEIHDFSSKGDGAESEMVPQMRQDEKSCSSVDDDHDESFGEGSLRQWTRAC
jgi:hypothetical protein